MTGRFLPGIPGPDIEAIFEAAPGNELGSKATVRNATLRLIRGMDLRLHPCSVAPAESPRSAGHAATRSGSSCNNAAAMRG